MQQGLPYRLLYLGNPMNIMNGMNENAHFRGQVCPLNEVTDEPRLCAEGPDGNNTLQCFRKCGENGTTSGALHSPYIMSGIDTLLRFGSKGTR